ncbi:MAG: PAS domain S-box protein [Dissulfurispiraceae bacterium]
MNRGFFAIMVAASMFFTGIIVSLMSIVFHGVITRDYLITGFITALVVSALIIWFTTSMLRRLRESEKKFRSYIENAPNAVLVSDLSGRFLDCNSAAVELLGYDVAALKGLSAFDIHPEEEREAVRQALETVARYGQFRGELRIRRSDGTVRWVSLNVNMIGSARVLGYLQDITERKRLEAQLLHAQKMEAIGTLAGGVAHDFNNILNVIIGYGTLAHDSLEAGSPSKEQMDEVLKAADRAATLIKRLLAFSRKQLIEVKPVNVNGLVLGLQKMLVRIIGEDIDLQFYLADRPLVVLADSSQIEQVLMNLATNARDAMPEGGRLTICTGLEEMDDDFIAVYGDGKLGMYAFIMVSDTGSGIDEETQQKIFEPFFTTKGVGEGTGLGLAISYGIVKQHGGYINGYSEPGQGAVFKIYLPLIEEEAVADKQAEASHTAMGGSETILVAEDEASLRNLIRIVLESSGYSVIIAEDGEHAIIKFMENKDNIALVVLDMIMPKKGGKEVSDVIRKLSPRIKILFSSGYTEDTMKAEELKESGFDFIPKPVRPQQLLRKVREVLDK